MEKVLFGDNQFFAINHLSDEKSRAQALKFRDTSSIMDVLGYVNDIGIKTFMCTTHDRIAEVCDQIRNNPARFKEFKIFPCMPYAHKYANAVTDYGIMGALKQYMPGNIISTFTKGGLAFATKDYIKMMELLIDAEMKMFKGIDTPVIFIQNVLTDLILGLGMNDVLVGYAEYIKKKYGAEPGFITMNLPLLSKTLTGLGLENPIICASINKIGFRMSGGIEEYERVIKEGKCRVIAMQVLAAGAISPDEAMDYVCNLGGIESILFGSSTKSHIQYTKNKIESLWNGRSQRSDFRGQPRSQQ
jgi:hypothetical protein